MHDNICTWCNQPGHRASHCPRAKDAFPLRASDLFWATLLVALIAGWFHA